MAVAFVISSGYASQAASIKEIKVQAAIPSTDETYTWIDLIPGTAKLGPRTTPFGEFKNKIFSRELDGRYSALRFCTGFVGPGVSQANYKLNGDFEGDTTAICYGNYTNQSKIGLAICVLKAIDKNAADCSNVDAKACVDDASIGYAQATSGN